ncbi:MAG: hypothetical protein AAFQ87_14210 [Bacteroidota bacterium]
MIKRKIQNTIFGYLLAILLVSISMNAVQAQDTPSEDSQTPTELKLIITHDGVEFIGQVLEITPERVLLITDESYEISIPRHEIKSVEVIDPKQAVGGKYVGEDAFSTRYFFSTNGLALKKGDHYAMLNYYGPEVHFALTDHLSVGVMSTWVAAPIVGSAKFSFPLAKKLNLGVGVLAGSLSWINSQANGALAYGALTIGDRQANLTISGGYAAIGAMREQQASGSVISLAGMIKTGRNTSLVFDSFILPRQDGNSAILIPGLRVGSPNGRGAFQFGAGVVLSEGVGQALPFPMASYMIHLR